MEKLEKKIEKYTIDELKEKIPVEIQQIEYMNKPCCYRGDARKFFIKYSENQTKEERIQLYEILAPYLHGHCRATGKNDNNTDILSGIIYQTLDLAKEKKDEERKKLIKKHADFIQDYEEYNEFAYSSDLDTTIERIRYFQEEGDFLTAIKALRTLKYKANEKIFQNYMENIKKEFYLDLTPKALKQVCRDRNLNMEEKLNELFYMGYRVPEGCISKKVEEKIEQMYSSKFVFTPHSTREQVKKNSLTQLLEDIENLSIVKRKTYNKAANNEQNRLALQNRGLKHKITELESLKQANEMKTCKSNLVKGAKRIFNSVFPTELEKECIVISNEMSLNNSKIKDTELKRENMENRIYSEYKMLSGLAKERKMTKRQYKVFNSEMRDKLREQREEERRNRKYVPEAYLRPSLY